MKLLRHFALAATLASLTQAAPIPLPTGNEITGKWLTGLGIQFLVPNRLPAFETPVIGLGPKLGIPIGDQHLELGVSYGTGSGENYTVRTLFITQLALKFSYRLPYLAGFVLGGGHYTEYSGSGIEMKKFGPTVGFGFLFPMGDGFKMAVEMQGYVIEKLLLGFGGSFAIEL